jgi:hypothetical protein
VSINDDSPPDSPVDRQPKGSFESINPASLTKQVTSTWGKGAAERHSEDLGGLKEKENYREIERGGTMKESTIYEEK